MLAVMFGFNIKKFGKCTFPRKHSCLYKVKTLKYVAVNQFFQTPMAQSEYIN